MGKESKLSVSGILKAGTKYRKKPVVVEAVQWFKNGDHPEDHLNAPEGPCDMSREGSLVRYFRRPDVPGQGGCVNCDSVMHDHGWIETLEGGHRVCPGDWIIKGIKGEFYPCKPDIFEAIHEEVNDA